MMTNMITVMEYTPQVDTWHMLNHYAPCVGVQSYQFKPEESLQLCDELKLRMLELSDFVEPSLFILPHEYRTKRSRSLKAPKRETEPAVPHADVIDTIEKLEKQEVDGNCGQVNADYAMTEDVESVNDNADQFSDEVQSETSSVASETILIENPWQTKHSEDDDANDQMLLGLIRSNSWREAVELHG
jgi:hypothetical protein